MIPLEQVDSIDSTSDELKRRLGRGEGDEVAIRADQQTGGRGRLGRQWASPPGNMYCSVLLRPGSLASPGHWSILAGVALAETIAQLLPKDSPLRLKWPNDLMLGDGKLAGILAEAGTEPAPWLVIGFGANLASSPAGLGRATACLADLGPPPAPELVARALLGSLAQWRARYDSEGFGPVRDAWLGFAPRPGELVRSSLGEGRFAGLAGDGALLLDTGVALRCVVSGEML